MCGKLCLVFVVALAVGRLAWVEEVDAQSGVDGDDDCESSALDEAGNSIGENLKDVRKDLKDVKEYQKDAKKDLKNVKEDLKDVKRLLETNQQQNGTCHFSERDLEDIKAACSSERQENCTSSTQQQCPSTECSASRPDFASSLQSSCIPLLIQQNINGSSTFNRSWAEYKAGFNDTKGNYWLGNDLLSQLTQSDRYKLRVDLQARNGSWYWAEYSSFVVLNKTHNYKLLVSGYSGNAGNALGNHDQKMFTTYDRDNDPWTNSDYNNNCAVWLGGGFWYKECARCSVNAGLGRDYFDWYSSSQTGDLYLQTSRMWLTC